MEVVPRRRAARTFAGCGRISCLSWRTKSTFQSEFATILRLNTADRRGHCRRDTKSALMGRIHCLLH